MRTAAAVTGAADDLAGAGRRRPHARAVRRAAHQLSTLHYALTHTRLTKGVQEPRNGMQKLVLSQSGMRVYVLNQGRCLQVLALISYRFSLFNH